MSISSSAPLLKDLILPFHRKKYLISLITLEYYIIDINIYNQQFSDFYKRGLELNWKI